MSAENEESCPDRSEMNVVGWFEIPVSDMNRAKKFYQTVFDAEFENIDMNGMNLAVFPMVRGGGGAAGALVRGAPFKPTTEGTLVYFVTESIEKSLEKIQKSGGKMLLPKTGIGEYGFIAHFQDTEGNRVALHAMQ